VTQNEDDPSLLRRVRHGGRRGGSEEQKRTYRSWRSMRERCTRTRHASYADYGARGITICPRWLHGENGVHPFLCFLEDMGPRPVGMSLDRINVELGYSKANCRWATPKEQRANQRKVARIEKFDDAEIEHESQQRLGQFRYAALKLRQAAALPADQQRHIFADLADLCERVADRLDVFAAFGSALRSGGNHE
jgi:hypothetical protein